MVVRSSSPLPTDPEGIQEPDLVDSAAAPSEPDEALAEAAEAESRDLAHRTHLKIVNTPAAARARLATLVPQDALDALQPAQRAYLAAYSARGLINQACRVARVDKTTVLYWRKRAVNHEIFSKAEAACKAFADELIEEELLRRGMEGHLEPVYGRVGKDQDGVVGHKRVYSDKLLLAAAQARLPGFARKVELSGPDGGPILVAPVVDALKAKLDAVERRRLEANAQATPPNTDGVEPAS